MQQPLNYERQQRGRRHVLRNVFGRIVLGSWAIFGAAFLVGLPFVGNDRSSLQWPAAILVGFSLIGALALTAFHWLVLIPVLWFRNRRSRTTP